MGGMWESAEGMKRLALGLVGTALAVIFVVLVAGQKMVAIQGPGSLGVTSAGTLWVGIDDRLWVLDAKGARIADKPVATLGLKEPPSNIVAMPDGNVLVANRGDDEWQVFDARTLRAVRTIHPHWPREFEENVRALHVAVSESGDIAAGTGGGHAVLLFDKDGRFLRRTKPGTFYFTNGLWHSAEGWWTTDTNRSRLHLLDDGTLEVKRTIELDPSVPVGHTALGELVPSHGQPRAGEAPLATVTRLGFLMTAGYIADVFADGSQELFNPSPIVLRDIAWFNGQLIAVDGGTYELLRFGADRKPLGEFGDAAVRAELRDLRGQREFWSMLASRWGLLLAIALFLFGIGAHARHKKLLAREVIDQRPATSLQSGPALAAIARQRFWIYGLPMAVRLASVAAGLALWPVAVRYALPAGTRTLSGIVDLFLPCVFGPLVIAIAWQQWRHERLMRNPRYESVLNLKAHGWLNDHADWESVADPGETVRESVFVAGWTKRWLLITNRRVLLFAASARERQLLNEWPRAAVAWAGAPGDEPGGGRRSVLRWLLEPRPNLLIVLGDGTRVRLRCASTVTAQRAARVLVGARDSSRALPAAARGRRATRRWREIVASFVLPGSGQWMQGRFVTGTVLFSAASLLFVMWWGPVLWASTGPKMHVPAIQKLWAFEIWLALSVVASIDAFNFSARKKRRALSAG